MIKWTTSRIFIIHSSCSRQIILPIRESWKKPISKWNTKWHSSREKNSRTNHVDNTTLLRLIQICSRWWNTYCILSNFHFQQGSQLKSSYSFSVLWRKQKKINLPPPPPRRWTNTRKICKRHLILAAKQIQQETNITECKARGVKDREQKSDLIFVCNIFHRQWIYLNLYIYIYKFSWFHIHTHT